MREPSKLLTERVELYRRQIDDEYGKTIGTLLTDWVRTDYAESNLGNFVTDAIRDQARSDFAVINGGGIRKDLPAGPITKLDINEILPFSNYLVTFECTGKDLLTLIKTNARAAALEKHSVLQVSGIDYSFRKISADDVAILSANVGANPLILRLSTAERRLILFFLDKASATSALNHKNIPRSESCSPMRSSKESCSRPRSDLLLKDACSADSSSMMMNILLP